MVEVKRKKGESFEALLRRFSRRIQQSGRVLQAKKVRFHKPEGNKNSLRTAALRREYLSARRDYMLKSGKMKEEDFGRKRKSYRG